MAQVLFYDNTGFSDDLPDIDLPTGTPQTTTPTAVDMSIQETDRKVKKLVNEGSRSTSNIDDWAELWVSVSSTWWRDYAKASGYTDDEPEKQKERTLPGNFGEAMPEYFLTDSRRAEIRLNFQNSLPQSARNALLSQYGLDGKLWLHDYVNIPLEAFNAIVGDSVKDALITRDKATPPCGGYNTLYSRELVCGHQGVKVIEKTGKRVIVDSQGIKLSFSDDLARAGTDTLTNMFFSSKCTVKEAFEAFAARKKLDISKLLFYNEVNVPGNKVEQQFYTADDTSKLWDTNMAVNGTVKVVNKEEEKPKEEEVPAVSESEAENSGDSGTPAAAAAAATAAATVDGPKDTGDEPRDLTLPPRSGIQMTCINDCYAISLLRALFTAPKFCSFIKDMKKPGLTAEQDDLLKYLDRISDTLYTLQNLPLPQGAGVFLGMLAKGQQGDVRTALERFVKQLDTHFFQLEYKVLSPSSETSDIKSDGIVWIDSPTETVQTVLNQWLFKDDDRQLVLPYVLPDVFVVSLQKPEDELRSSRGKNRCEFDCNVSVPQYDEEEIPNVVYDAEKDTRQVGASVKYDLVAVTMHVGMKMDKDGEIGHYVAVTRRSEATSGKVLDNIGSFSDSTWKVVAGRLKLDGPVTQGTISMCTLFYQRTGL